jgi:hypothetical protein
MDHVDKIAKGEPPADPDKIIKATIAGDEKKADSKPADKAPEAAPAKAAK